MAVKKDVEGKQPQQKDLWKQRNVESVSLRQFVKDTADVEKMILYGESNAGKSRWFLNILSHLKKTGVPKENILMYVIYPDRATGITKLANLVPKEFADNVKILTINCYEELVMSTALAEERLMEHYKKTGVHGWMVIELLSEVWRMSQDYYARQAFGESLADLLAAKRQAVQEVMKEKGKEDKTTAFQALSGFADWTTIKFFHNFNWIDKIKKMPFNVVFTSEIKNEDSKDSMFSAVGKRPGGEKDNIHRVDTILYLTHIGDKFEQRCFKLTGYSRIYSGIDITDKNGYEVHQAILKKFESKGYKSSAIEELEAEAGIPSPEKAKPEVKKEETHDALEDHQKMAEDKSTPKDRTKATPEEQEEAFEKADIKTISKESDKTDDIDELDDTLDELDTKPEKKTEKDKKPVEEKPKKEQEKETPSGDVDWDVDL